MKLTSNDPTFETKGNFQAIILNKTNEGLWGRRHELTYDKLPPKKWEKGKDWKCIDGLAHSFNSSGKYNRIGAYAYLDVLDRSSAHIKEGYTYTFCSSFGTDVRFCFKIIGVAGGSIVIPGFGLCNITKKPNEWTYLWPTDFHGSWGIQILSGHYAAPYSLSVQYKPLQWNPSAFIFTWDGATFSKFDTTDAPVEKLDQPMRQEILIDPRNYIIKDIHDE